MLKLRITYFLLFIATIVAGLLSRRITIIPLFIGDVLYATMVYWLMRLMLINKAALKAGVIGLAFCYTIEISQLYKAHWINELRQTLFGRLVLGNTFLWSDLVWYTLGIGLGLLLDKYIQKKNFS
jgi:hypothetical protein